MKTIAEQLNVKYFPFTIKDKEGNRIYFETSNGYWSKSEYDKDGNEIYSENSEGYWSKSEYKDGRKIYYENSYCIIFDYRTTEMTIAEIEKKLNITNLKIKK
jgi:uncharacterized membrane protein